MVKPAVSRKRQRTREVLVEATLAVIADKGVAAISLDEVAARAGVTKGAIYSNYRNKGELLWEAVGRKGLYLNPELIPGAPLPAQARPMARAVMALLPQSAQDAEFHHELQAHIRTDPDLRARQHTQYKALFDAIADQLEAGYRDQLAVPARSAALAIQALIWGFIVQWEQSPDEVTEDIVATAFELLAIGAVTPR